MKPSIKHIGLSLLAGSAALVCAVIHAQQVTGTPGSPGGTPKYAPDVPAKITTPDSVQTSIGTLRFTVTFLFPK